jgi:SAM-dependent methyltransferase
MTTAAPRIDLRRARPATAEEAATAADAALGSRLSSLTYDPFLWRAERAGMAELRRRLVAGARGNVLELGAGTGLNVPHYPGGLDQLVLTEPGAHMAERLRRRLERDGRRAEIVRAPAELLPFDGGTFDTVVSIFALCTVTDPEGALAEVRRVLRADGRLLFLEHVRSDDRRLARWQDRLHGPWASFADGCRCNQRTLEILRAEGFEVTAVDRAEWRRMPRIVRPVVLGSARPRAGGRES